MTVTYIVTDFKRVTNSLNGKKSMRWSFILGYLVLITDTLRGYTRVVDLVPDRNYSLTSFLPSLKMSNGSTFHNDR